jgi:histidinol-phosphatase (PHP family)
MRVSAEPVSADPALVAFVPRPQDLQRSRHGLILTYPEYYNLARAVPHFAKDRFPGGSPFVLPDYHIHSTFSCDASDSMDALCRRALALGLSEIGISEHCDFHPLDECRGYFRPEPWWKAIEASRREYGNELTLRASLELGEPHQFQEQVGTLLQDYPWDYILGSLHWVDDTIIFSPGYFNRPAAEAYKLYFEKLLQVVENGEFDILAHMDIVKRYGYDSYGPFDPHTYEPEIRAVLHALVESERALEINSSTLRRPVGETSPTQEILRWFREEGGRFVTFGSDAHTVSDLGAGWEEVAAEMRAAGFDEFATFHNRQPELHPLPQIEETV